MDKRCKYWYSIDDQDIGDTPVRSLMSRHSKLSHKASVLVDDASLTVEGSKFSDEQLGYLHQKIKEMNISRTSTDGSQRKTSLDKANNINDPSGIRTKGCGKRLKSSKEKVALKSRVCHGCGKRGVSHDKRNCPLLNDGYVNHNFMIITF